MFSCRRPSNQAAVHIKLCRLYKIGCISSSSSAPLHAEFHCVPFVEVVVDPRPIIHNWERQPSTWGAICVSIEHNNENLLHKAANIRDL